LLLSLLFLLAPPQGLGLAHKPTAQSVLLATEDAPRIDGWLQESCWQRLQPIGELVEVEPREGQVPDERTVVRIAHTRDHIYLAIQCFDSQAQGIRATQMDRDARLDPDDRVEWFFDTFHDRRNAYWFQIGAGGGPGDALIYNNGQRFNKDWDTIWRAHARITADGWQAEVQIPFRSMAFDPEKDTWGFNLVRWRKRQNAEDRWASPARRVRFFAVSEAGTLTGMRGAVQGVGIDVVPYLKYSVARTRSVARSWDHDLEAGGDAFYRITPSLTAAVTVNTDFAETESDARLVNLTRFPLFFPEKRDFFLEDASLFEFGPRDDGFLPFFSRRIGLGRGGVEIPILGGGKVAGRAGDWNLGVLDVHTDDPADGEENLLVTRVSRNVGEQSSVGALFTHGRPGEPGDNSMLGVDGVFQSSNWLDSQRSMRVIGYAAATRQSGVGGDGAAGGISIANWNDFASVELDVQHIDDEFRPALGFVRRRGVTSLRNELQFTPRPEAASIRKFRHKFEQSWFLDQRGELESVDLDLEPCSLELESDDELAFGVLYTFDRLDDPFDIHPGVTIPSGRYDLVAGYVALESAEGRALSCTTSFRYGGFYAGRRTEFEVRPVWRVSRHLTLGARYERNWIDLDQGSFQTKVIEGNVDIALNPELGVKNLVQYDSVSEELSWQSRLRWIVQPGSDLFVVLGYSWDGSGSGAGTRPDNQGVIVKLQHTLRF
jgi:hypothetical protein